jgi:glutathione S-transferase
MLVGVPHTLYVIHGSHPCVTAERALQLKRQPYRVVEYPPAFHVPLQWRRFRRTTVPGLVLGSGEQVVGSRAIVHRLDALVPDPPLLPADATARARVEEAERWGDKVLQPLARRLAWAGFVARPDAFASYAVGSRLPLPARLLPLIVPPLARVASRRNRATVAQARADLAALPGHLDRVDGWIAEGVLGGEQPNAADLQIASSLRLLGTFADVRPLLEDRPCWPVAQRLFPQYAGDMPASALPAAA